MSDTSDPQGPREKKTGPKIRNISAEGLLGKGRHISVRRVQLAGVQGKAANKGGVTAKSGAGVTPTAKFQKLPPVSDWLAYRPSIRDVLLIKDLAHLKPERLRLRLESADEDDFVHLERLATKVQGRDSPLLGKLRELRQQRQGESSQLAPARPSPVTAGQTSADPARQAATPVLDALVDEAMNLAADLACDGPAAAQAWLRQAHDACQLDASDAFLEMIELGLGAVEPPVLNPLTTAMEQLGNPPGTRVLAVPQAFAAGAAYALDTLHPGFAPHDQLNGVSPEAQQAYMIGFARIAGFAAEQREQLRLELAHARKQGPDGCYRMISERCASR